VLKRHITDEADFRMACYVPPAEPVDLPSGAEVPERPKLPEGTVDVPLVRLYNFLREYGRANSPPSAHDGSVEMMSLSYQLQILWYQVSP
jgi:mediator of RNA polymerase II transcription subunit 14